MAPCAPSVPWVDRMSVHHRWPDLACLWTDATRCVGPNGLATRPAGCMANQPAGLAKVSRPPMAGLSRSVVTVCAILRPVVVQTSSGRGGFLVRSCTSFRPVDAHHLSGHGSLLVRSSHRFRPVVAELLSGCRTRFVRSSRQIRPASRDSVSTSILFSTIARPFIRAKRRRFCVRRALTAVAEIAEFSC